MRHTLQDRRHTPHRQVRRARRLRTRTRNHADLEVRNPARIHGGAVGTLHTPHQRVCQEWRHHGFDERAELTVVELAHERAGERDRAGDGEVRVHVGHVHAGLGQHALGADEVGVGDPGRRILAAGLAEEEEDVVGAVEGVSSGFDVGDVLVETAVVGVLAVCGALGEEGIDFGFGHPCEGGLGKSNTRHKRFIFGRDGSAFGGSRRSSCTGSVKLVDVRLDGSCRAIAVGELRVGIVES